jgi:hypothetical protein
VQEQLLGFLNDEVILESGRHHVAEFAIGQELPPKRRNPAKKNQHASDSLVHKQSK